MVNGEKTGKTYYVKKSIESERHQLTVSGLHIPITAIRRLMIYGFTLLSNSCQTTDGVFAIAQQLAMSGF